MLFLSRLVFIVVLVAVVVVVDARQPSCAVLFCNATTRAQLWLDAAQDEMFELLELSFGGYAANSGNPFPPCAQLETMLDAIVCFDSDDQLPPAKCASQDCDFCAHCEFYDIGPRECCKPCDADKCPPGFPSGSPSPPPVCLTLRKWAAIGIEKLYAAYAFRDAGDTASEVSYACAAQRALSFVVGKLEQGGCADPADHCNEHYRHIVGPAINDSFDVAPLPNANGLPLVVATRTIQTFCGANHHGERHSLLATYLLAYVVQRDDTAADASTIQQLVWPIGGSVPAFDKTSLPPNNECARSAAPSTIVPLFDASRRLPTLGAENFAVVLDGTACCDGFPTHGTLVRTYRDLNPASDCSALTLIVDIDAALRGGTGGKHHHHQQKDKCTGSNVTTWSFTYVAHRKSTDTYETALDVDIASTLFVRLAEPGTCVDFPADPAEATATSNNEQRSADRRALTASSFRQPLDGIPITLPPGESVCVGGDRAGTRCTARSQCGSGLKCEPSLDDASVGFCYDGTWWNAALPCTLGSGDECPYGVCFGAANAHEGGAYPALHAWQAAQCDTSTPPDAQRCAALGDWRASVRLDSVK